MKSFNLNIEAIPKELKLILNLLKTSDVNNLIVTKKEFQDVDWRDFLELAYHHRVYPLLFGKVKKLGENLIPAYVIHTLGNLYKRNTFEMLRLSGEMGYLSSIFNNNKIRTLVLKGPVLAEDLYGDLSLRTCKDLDILVSFFDLEKVDQLLQKEGYQRKEYINMSLNDWKWRNHHFEYHHPLRRVNVEIHWRLNPFPGGGPSFEQLWKRKRKSSLTSAPTYYLGSEDLFLFLASHGARHGWFRLRWLVDISQMMKQDVNWKNLNKELRRHQYLPVGGEAVVLASSLLNAPVNNEMESLVKGSTPRKLAQAAIFYLEKIIDLHTEPVDKEIDNYHKKHLLSLMTNKQRCLYFLSFLYPYPLDAETLPLPKKLHLLYFPLRPFLWIWRKTKKHALP